MLHNQLKLLKLDQRIPPQLKHGNRDSKTQKKIVHPAVLHMELVGAAVMSNLQLKSSSELKIPTPHRFS